MPTRTDPRLSGLSFRVRRRVLLHRRPLAALLLGIAVLGGLQATAAPPAPDDRVWTAARDLPAGTVITTGDLVRIGFAPGTVPAGASSEREALVGRQVAVPVWRGEPLREERLVGPGLLSGQSGRSGVPVRISDPAVAELLRVGDRVDLVAADPQGRAAARLLVGDAVVLAVPPAPDDALADSLPGRLVLFAVPAQTRDTLVSASATSFVTATWTR